MLVSVGFGMLPAAMWTRNSGPIAIAARLDFSSTLVATNLSSRLRVAEFLLQQRVKIVARELLEEIVQTLLQSRAGKTRFLRPQFQRELAEGIIRLQPVFRHFVQNFHHAVG